MTPDRRRRAMRPVQGTYEHYQHQFYEDCQCPDCERDATIGAAIVFGVLGVLIAGALYVLVT
jgi:hypothetical protein